LGRKGRIPLTPQLQGDLAETYFKHYSINRGFAYARPDAIGGDLIHRNTVIFQRGFERFQVEIPNEICDLLVQIARPSNRDPFSPSYTFDFITVPIDYPDTQVVIVRKANHKFVVVEIKSGQSDLTPNEETVKKMCEDAGIRYAVFRILNINSKPPQEWDFVSEE
jgi:hypothetical protein